MNWVVFFRELQGSPAFFRVDMGYAKAAPVQDLPQLVRLAVTLISVSDDGLPLDNEFSMLEDMEDALDAALATHSDIANVGCYTAGGKRHCYFYAAPGQEYKAILESALSAFPQYSHTIEAMDDPAWECYQEFLLPTEDEQYALDSDAQLQQLEEDGVDLSVPRTVEHFVFFLEAVEAEMFGEFLSDEGLTVDRVETVDPEEETGIELGGHEPRYVGVYSHEIPLDNLTGFALLLKKGAPHFNAVYDGWEVDMGEA